MGHRRQATHERLPCVTGGGLLGDGPVHRLGQKRLELRGQCRDALGNHHRTHASNTSSNHRHFVLPPDPTVSVRLHVYATVMKTPLASANPAGCGTMTHLHGGERSSNG